MLGWIRVLVCLFQRFVPASDLSALPRVDIIAEDLGGYCYSWWSYSGGNRLFSEVHLTPNSECTVTRTLVHEVGTWRKKHINSKIYISNLELREIVNAQN